MEAKETAEVQSARTMAWIRTLSRIQDAILSGGSLG